MPNEAKPINEKKQGDSGYVCFSHKSERFELYAANLGQAAELARAHCKPPKSKRHLVSVHLAEDKEGKVVIHTAVD